MRDPKPCDFIKSVSIFILVESKQMITPPGADDFLPVLIYVTLKNLDLCEHVEVLAIELWVLQGLVFLGQLQ
uniref:VPS9 domain-containing protein n=1 Tax=Solanum lycopersicum TaxID=4081 RepID=A0A3Q7EM77_SOLLC